MLYLKQSTAGQTVLIGPFIDKDDGVTAETALTINAADIRLSANGGNMFAKTSGGGTHDEEGFYAITLDATDTATVGHLQISVQDATTHLPVYHELTVLEENVYDAWYAASGAAGTDLASILTDTGTTLQAELDGIQADTEDLQTQIGTAGAGLTAVPWNAAWDAQVESEVDDALTTFFTSAANLVDLIWDEALTGATHDVATSAGKRLRQIDAAFEVHSGTAQGGGANTITLDTGASSTNDIYNGDRIVITEGTGAQEHGIVVDYDGGTFVATMAENWVVQPDATSVFEVIPADVDVETWQHNAVTASGGGFPDVNVNEVGDTAQTAGDLAALINALNDLSAATVATEISDALRTDTLTATAQGAPPTTPTFMAAIMTLYDALVHAVDVTATSKEFKNNGGTVIWKKALSDDATTYTEAESASGP